MGDPDRYHVFELSSYSNEYDEQPTYRFCDGRFASPIICLLCGAESLSACSFILPLVFSIASLQAQTTDTWNSTGTSVDWNTGANWSGGTPPVNDTTTNMAGFSSSSYSFQPSLTLDTQQSINGIAFSGGATAAAVTLSAPVDSQASSSTASTGSSTITVASIGTLVVGEQVSDLAGGRNQIALGTYITGISGTLITLSKPTYATVSSGDTLNFTPTLTIGSGGITVGAAVSTVDTISAPVILASSQTWTNSSSNQNNYLSVTNVNLGSGQTLTLNAGTKSFNAASFWFSGNNALTGSGTLVANTGVTLIGTAGGVGDSVANTSFSGILIVGSGGTIQATGGNNGSGSSVGILGSGTLIINGGTFALGGNLNGVSSGVAQLASNPNNGLLNGTEVWNADFAVNLNGKGSGYMGTGAVSLGTVAGGGINRTITMDNNFGGATFTLGGVISNGVTANGITLAGTAGTNATLQFTGTNTYTGKTIIKQGTIAVANTGSIHNSSNIIVGDTSANSQAAFSVSGVSTTGGYHIVSGQTLSGFGTIKGGTVTTTIDSGATVAPGNGNVGKLSFNGTSTTAALSIQGNILWSLGSLTDNSTGTAGTDFSQIALTGLGGNLSLTGGELTLSFLNGISTPDAPGASFWQTNHTWTIIAGTNSNTNTGSTQLSGIANGIYADGSFSTLADANGNDTLTYTVAAVPEPSTYILMLCGLGILFAFRKRVGRRQVG